ncbi:hypothetical protein AB0K68_24980 [Streptomyces sp. NPDC050698]
MGMPVTITKKKASGLLGATALSAAVILGLTASPALALGKNGLAACRGLGGTVINGDACKFNGPWRPTADATAGDHATLRNNCDNVHEAGSSMTVTDGIEGGFGSQRRAIVICR